MAGPRGPYMGVEMFGGVEMQQQQRLVMTPRLRQEVDEDEVRAKTLLPGQPKRTSDPDNKE